MSARQTALQFDAQAVRRHPNVVAAPREAQFEKKNTRHPPDASLRQGLVRNADYPLAAHDVGQIADQGV
jgi:hypothetical protein